MPVRNMLCHSGRYESDGCLRHGLEHPGTLHDAGEDAGREKNARHHEGRPGVRIDAFALHVHIRVVDHERNAGPDHEHDRRRDVLSLQDLAQYPLVLMDPDTSVRAIVDAAFVAVGRLPIPACEATYMMTTVGMVRAGLGITVLPASAKEIKAEPSLKSRAIDNPAFARPIAVIKKRNRTLPPAAESFLAEMMGVTLSVR
jgi:DNA-binding transcriptional LysR family regulator